MITVVSSDAPTMGQLPSSIGLPSGTNSSIAVSDGKNIIMFLCMHTYYWLYLISSIVQGLFCRGGGGWWTGGVFATM